MKFFLILLIFLIGCSGDPIDMDEKLFERGGLWITNDNYSGFFYFNQKVYSGPAFLLHRKGKKKEEGPIKRGYRAGIWTGWDQDGKKKFSGEYFKGKEHGKWEGWHPNGNKKYEGSYDDGFQVGLWTYYDAKGKKNLEETYFSEPIYQKGQISETKEY